MIVTVDAVEVATQLTDNDLVYKELKLSQRYVDSIRNTTEWKRRYDYYFEIITNNAHIPITNKKKDEK
jgi:hypothetical protein